jgi:TolA-binding protein
MSQGWIKLHRAIAEHPRFKDPKWLQVWIKCLVLATHKAYKTVFDGKVIELQPGQFITSRKSLAKETDTNESKVERILKTLEIEQQIEQVGGATSRLITVTKWNEFQSGEQDDEQRVNNDRTTNEQRVNTNKNGKNTKNGKKKNKTSEVDADLLPSSLPDPENLQATKDTLQAAIACDLLENPNFSTAWNAFLEMRKGLKFPAGLLAQERILDKLKPYPVEVAI